MFLIVKLIHDIITDINKIKKKEHQLWKNQNYSTLST